jgi:hypothetical protein
MNSVTKPSSIKQSTAIERNETNGALHQPSKMSALTATQSVTMRPKDNSTSALNTQVGGAVTWLQLVQADMQTRPPDLVRENVWVR